MCTKTAWQHVSPEVAIKEFSEVLYVQCMDGTNDDDMLWNGSKEDGNVRIECEGDEGTDCGNGDSDTDW